MRSRIEAVVFDVDGVISNCDHRMHFVTTDPQQDWDSFNNLCTDDIPNQEWTRLVSLLYTPYRVLLLTSRNEVLREPTEDWLAKWQVGYDELIMRPRGATYLTFKDEAMRRLLNLYRVVLAVDDDQRHVATFRSLGVPTIQATSQFTPLNLDPAQFDAATS